MLHLLESNDQLMFEIDRLFDRLNLPEEQIQEFFETEQLQLTEFQKSQVYSEIDNLMIDKINDNNDIIMFKKTLILLAILKWDGLEKLFTELDLLAQE